MSDDRPGTDAPTLVEESDRRIARRERRDNDDYTFERRCLSLSLAISWTGIVLGTVGFWVTRFYNVSAADERCSRSLVTATTETSMRPAMLRRLTVTKNAVECP